MQDLSEEVQTLIHRIQPREQVEAAVRALRSAGISRINMDVMYGLPAQTRALLEDFYRVDYEMFERHGVRSLL